MPATEQNKAQVAERLNKKAAESASAGRGLIGTATGLGDILMESIRADRAQRGVSKLATDQGNVMGQMVTDPNTIRDFGTTEGFRMDPLDVDKFTSGARAQNLSTLGTIGFRDRQNEGNLQESIQAGANQLKAMAESKYAEAERYASEATALMEKLRYEQDEKMQALQRALLEEDLRASRSGGDAGFNWPDTPTPGGVPEDNDPEGVADGFEPEPEEPGILNWVPDAVGYVGNKANNATNWMSNLYEKYTDNFGKLLDRIGIKPRRNN